MAKKEKAPLTREELIAEAFCDYAKDKASVNYITEIPDNLSFKIGDDVEIGNIHGFKIAEIKGNLILIENTQIEEPSKTASSYSTRPFLVKHWSQIFPKSNLLDTKFSWIRPVRVNYINTDLESVIGTAMRRGLNDQTDYQRDYKWTLEDKQRLIKSIFEGKEIGKFIFVEDKTYRDPKVEVLDGKQRLKAILGYLQGEFAYEGIYYHQLSRKDRNSIDSLGVQYAALDRNKFTRLELLEIFKLVNDAGVPQTEEHMKHIDELIQIERDHEQEESASLR